MVRHQPHFYETENFGLQDRVNLAPRRRFESRTEMKAIRVQGIVSLWDATSRRHRSSAPILTIKRGSSFTVLFDSSGNGVVLRYFCARGKSSSRSVFGGGVC